MLFGLMNQVIIANAVGKSTLQINTSGGMGLSAPGYKKEQFKKN